jgi:hypothetical protein
MCGEPTSLRLNNIIKGIVSQDEYVFEGPKNQNIIFCMSADGFDQFWLFFYDNNQKKISAYFFQITSCPPLPSSPFNPLLSG